jgi:uncharacterized membrane protein (DUF4010 family)
MRIYFVTANLWLALAYVVFMGRHWERGEPTMYSINYRDERRAFGIGFAFVLILYSVSVLRDAMGDSILRFNWLVNIRRELTDDSVITWAARNTAHYGAILDVSTIGDCIFLAIYRQAHERSE